MTSTDGKITATFWDCGGVFLTNGWDHIARKCVIEHFGLDFDEFESRHEQPNDQWERGKITWQQYLDATVFYRPRPFTMEEFMDQVRAVSRVLYPAMVEFVRRLRRQDSPDDRILVYLLSNESRELMAYRIPKFGLTGLFDAFLVSAYIGLRKPERAFFQCALDVSQCRPEQCVFIDDREENVSAARALGIHAIRLETPQQAISELEQLGIRAA